MNPRNVKRLVLASVIAAISIVSTRREPVGRTSVKPAEIVPLVESRQWNLPPALPPPRVPDDNPMSETKIELGRHLFHDKRLSGNGSQSCASCHRPELAFTDGRRTALGSTGESHFRNSMSLVNVAYAASHTWADASMTRLERQAIVPMTNQAPVEMGMAGREGELVARLEREPRYRELFDRAFPNDPRPVSMANVARAIATFERSIVSFDSPYDRFMFRGETDALSPQAWRGMKLFFSERTKCGQCHSGLNLAGPSATVEHVPQPSFHNTALYDVTGRGGYPESDRGLRAKTGRPTDDGAFKVPTLRNIAVTAPYMHDGSIATLEDVIAHYAAGGRAASNPDKSRLLTGFSLSREETSDLIAFLESLTDESLLSDPRFSDPWVEDEPGHNRGQSGL